MTQTTFLWPPPDRDRRSATTLRELPLSEHPTYRLDHHGPGALSTVELLAILVGTQLQVTDAVALMARYGKLSAIASAPLAELRQQPGIGEATARRIKAALALGQRIALEGNDDRVQVRSPADAANLLIPTMGALEQEELHVLLLDTKHCLVADVMVYRGSVNTTMIRVAELFREAIRRQVPSIILAHNHPSGDPTPSPDDVTVTRQAVEAGKLLDIDVLDHLVIGSQRFISLKERGLGF